MKCPKCKFDKVKDYGWSVSGKKRLRCLRPKCRHVFVDKTRQRRKANPLAYDERLKVIKAYAVAGKRLPVPSE